MRAASICAVVLAALPTLAVSQEPFSAAVTQPEVGSVSFALKDADVMVAVRRLRKGSLVTCGDLATERRMTLRMPRRALTGSCALPTGTVALRDLAVGDVVRTIDVGKAPDVQYGSSVHVLVEGRGVIVTAQAIALADAHAGDQIEVRLARSPRILRARVIGPGSVKILD